MWDKVTVRDLINQGVLYPPLDGNHGGIHPKSSEFDFEIDLKKCKFISVKQAKSLRKGIAKSGDVLLTHKATIGKTALIKSIPYEFLMLTPQVTFYRVKNHTKLDNRYLKFYFSSAYFQELFSNWAGSGGTRSYLGILEQQKLPIVMPPFETQQKIADILSVYDDLIENNKRRIEMLEHTAQQIYKEWFVRFRFPGYKKIKFERNIPSGWNFKYIKDFGEVITGKTPSTENTSFYGDKVPFIKTPDMHGNIFILETSEYLSILGGDSQKKMYLPKNSICVNCIGALAGSVSITTEICQSNQQIHSIIINRVESLEYLLFAVRGLRETIILFGNTGSTMTNLSKGKFEKLKILYPTDEILLKYHDLCKPIFDQIKRLGLKNKNLVKQRDLLLPRLMSGKLEV